MVVLITYLPFYRIHEISEYFIKNIEIISPRTAIAYIDNVYHERQKEIISKVLPSNIDVITGNWRNRNSTWITILKDFFNFNDEIMVIDSDNIVEQTFPQIHSELRRMNMIYTILDEETWKRNPRHLLVRSRKVSEIKVNNGTKPIYAYRVYDGSINAIFKGGSIFFIGPKQVVVLTKMFDIEILNRVEKALNNVDPWLRNFISDETLLGIIAHLMSISEVPWTIASHHYHHGSTLGRATKFLVAAAHYQFSEGLVKEFKIQQFRRYMIKYALSMIKNFRSIVSSHPYEK